MAYISDNFTVNTNAHNLSKFFVLRWGLNLYCGFEPIFNEPLPFVLIVNTHTLKLLCTLARLCEGIPLRPLRLNISLASPPLTISVSPFLPFSRAGQENRTGGKARRAHERAPIPNLPTPGYIAPHTHLPLIRRRGNLHAATAPFRVAARRWRNVSLAFRETFSPFTQPQ